MLFQDIKEFRIQYDEGLHFMRVEWIGGRSMQHFQAAQVQVQLLAKQLQVTTVLYDMDTMPDLSVYDQMWLAAQWMPAIMQLPLQQVVVVMGAKRVYNQQAVEVLFQGFRLFMKFDFQFFTQVLPGLQFLLGSSPHLPALLAEWQEGYGGPIPSGQNLSTPLPPARPN